MSQAWTAASSPHTAEPHHRTSRIKQDTLFLQHIQAALLEHFTKQADA
jgi:hypothetical protein